ncbi:MAG: autotransporter-associated beta strand repeat-containing protein [Kiritimatiellales bacterium]
MGKRVIGALIFAGLCLAAQAADIVKTNSATYTNLSVAAAWIGAPATAPGANDVATWSTISAGAGQRNQVDANLSWKGIKFQSSLIRDITFNGTSGTTLTLGSSGIDMTQTGGSLIMNNDVVLGAAQTWAVTNTHAITVNGILSGASGNTLTKSGLGTLTLAGANTYSGGTILDAGGLNIINAQALGTGALTINGGELANTSGATVSNANNNAQNWNGDFSFVGKNNVDLGTGAVTLGGSRTINITQSYNTLTVDGVIDDGVNTYSLTKIGAGQLTLVGANTYGGGTVLNEGKLSINNARALGTGALTINGGTIDNSTTGMIVNANNNAQNWNGDFTFHGTRGWDIGTGAVTLGGNRTVTSLYNNLIVGGTIDDGTNTYSLTKAGGGQLTLAGANTYGGGTILNEGTLYINNAQALGSGILTINGGAIGNNTAGTLINANNNAQNWNGDFSAIGPKDLDLGTGAVTLGRNLTITNRYGTLTVGGVIDDGVNTYSLTKEGAATLVLTAANTYGGETIINNGILRIGNARALGSTEAGTTVNVGSELELSGGITVTNELLTLNGGELCNVAGTDTYSGAITLTANSVVDSDAGTLRITSAISGAHGLDKAGTGTVELSGANTYSGTTTISAGMLTASNALALQNSTLNYTNNSGTMRFAGGIAAYTLGGLEGNKNLALTNAGGTAIALAVGNNGSNTTYSGALSGGGRLIKTGAGTLTFTGANTYTNTTTVSFGGLIVNGSMLSKQITVSAGAMLGGTGTVQAVTMDAGSILTVGDGRGTMTFNSALLLSAGSTNIMEILSGNLYDVLKGNGANTLTARGVFVFDFTGNTTLTNGSTFAVLQNWGSVTTNGATFSTIGLTAGQSLDTSNLSHGFVTVVPEPATVLLLAVGGGLTWILRLKQRY